MCGGGPYWCSTKPTLDSLNDSLTLTRLPTQATDSTTDSVDDSVNYPFLILLSIPSSCIYIDPLDLYLQLSRLFNSLHYKAYKYTRALT